MQPPGPGRSAAQCERGPDSPTSLAWLRGNTAGPHSPRGQEPTGSQPAACVGTESAPALPVAVHHGTWSPPTATATSVAQRCVAGVAAALQARSPRHPKKVGGHSSPRGTGRRPWSCPSPLLPRDCTKRGLSASAARAPCDVTRRRPRGAARGSRGLLGSGLPPPPAPATSFPSLTPPRSHA